MAWWDDWMNIVRDISICGMPEVLDDMAGKWETHLSRVRVVAERLREGKSDQERAWNSPGGKAYGTHLETIAKAVDAAETQLRPVIQMLKDASRDLKTARANIPIPDAMRTQVIQSHQMWLLANPFSQPAIELNIALFSDVLESTFGDAADRAQAAADELNKQNQYTNDGAGTPVAPSDVRLGDRPVFDPTTGDVGGPTRGVGDLGTGGLPGSTGGYDPSASGLSGTGGGGPGAGWDSGGTGIPDATGLSGAGDGLTGLGGAGGGLGAGGLGADGLGSGGLGAGRGLGAGLAPDNAIGPGVGPTGRGAGLGGGAGMMGGGVPGRGGAGSGDARDTWLTEDEDVWGADTDAAPAGGVLGPDHRYGEGY
jgi:hypothetical protein